MTFSLQDRLMYLGQCEDPYITARDIHTAKLHRSGWLSSILDDYWCSTQTTPARTKPTKVSNTPETSSQAKHVTNGHDKVQYSHSAIIDNTNAESVTANEPAKMVEGMVQTDAEVVNQKGDRLDVVNHAQIAQKTYKQSQEEEEEEEEREQLCTANTKLHKEESKAEMQQTPAISTTNRTESEDEPNTPPQQQQEREKELLEEPNVSVIVDKLFDKIRLNAVKVVALDDINQQLMEHFAKLSSTNEHATQIATITTTTTKTGGPNIINLSTSTVSNTASPVQIPATSVSTTTSSEWPIVNGLELSQCLYALRAQVKQLREQVIAREEYLTEHERQVKLEFMRANHKNRKTRHIKVEVVRAYEEEPKPYVKPPYRPVSWPKHKSNSNYERNTSSGLSNIATSTKSHSSFTGSNALYESEESFPTYATMTPVSSVIATESTPSLSNYNSSTNTRSHLSVRSDSTAEKTGKKRQTRHDGHTSTTSFPSSSYLSSSSLIDSTSSEEYSSQTYSEKASYIEKSETSSMSSAESKDSALELYRRRRRQAMRIASSNKQDKK